MAAKKSTRKTSTKATTKTGEKSSGSSGSSSSKKKTAKKAGKKKATKAAKPSAKKASKKAAAKEPAKAKPSSLAVNMGHVFGLRPRINTSFKPGDFATAKHLLQDESYSDLREAAKAVVEKALELTHDGPSHGRRR